MWDDDEGHCTVLCQMVIIHKCSETDPAEPTLAVAVACFTSSKCLKLLYSVIPSCVYM